MRPLGWWLMLVGSLRLASVWFGFFDIWALRLAVFSQTDSKLLYLSYAHIYTRMPKMLDEWRISPGLVCAKTQNVL